MTIAHKHIKGIDLSSHLVTTTCKPKLMPHYNQLGNKIKSIMLEHNSNELLLRQPAGLDRSKVTSKTRKQTAPRVCKYQQEYERKRLQRMRRVSKAQNHLRRFHSHPVPDFSRMHKHWERCNKMRQLKSLHNITEPQTPKTLQNSIAAKEKLEQRLKQLDRELNVPSKFKLPLSTSWREERGELRRQFDERCKLVREAQWEAMAMEFTRRQNEEYRLMRKLTNFKARPNPWRKCPQAS